MRQAAIESFLSQHGYGDAALAPLAGDASFRRYIRLQMPTRSLMLMDAPPEKEDVRPYLAIARHLKKYRYSTPEIIADDAPHGLLLLEDLGDDTFSRILRADSAKERMLYEAAIDTLADWHRQDAAGMQPSALPLPAYDHALLMREVGLFAEWFLPRIGKPGLAAEYLALWEKLLKEIPLQTQHFVHRDYHADNLMWLPDRRGIERVGLLDFQDGVWGDAAYDLVSLLEDARRDVPRPLAEAMLARYLQKSGEDKNALMRRYALLGAQRNSKIVGIFVRLSARDGKHGYLDFLPRVWAHLEHDVKHPALKPLADWLDTHIPQTARGKLNV